MKINDHLFTFAEIARITLEVLRRSWKPLLVTFGGSMLIIQLVNAFFYGANPVLQQQVMQEYPTLTIFTSLLSMLVGMWGFVASALVISQTLQKGKAQAKLSIKEGFGKLWPVMGASLLLGIALGIVVLVLILLATLFMAVSESAWLSILLGLALMAALGLGCFFLVFFPYAIALGDVKALSSFRYSYTLVRGHYWKTVGFFVLAGLINGIGSGVMMLLSLVTLPMATVLPTMSGLIVWLIGLPVAALAGATVLSATVVLYVNRQAVLHPEPCPAADGVRTAAQGQAH